MFMRTLSSEIINVNEKLFSSFCNSIYFFLNLNQVTQDNRKYKQILSEMIEQEAKPDIVPFLA